MSKKLYIILYVLFLIVLSSFVYATDYTWCYQESANVSTSCGGLDNGSYSFTNGTWFLAGFSKDKAIDGDWDTYTSCTTPPCELYINYSKPTLAINSSVWQVKTTVSTNNFTINESCWNREPLQFRVSVSPSTIPYVNTSCYDGSNWNYINSSHKLGGIGIYEEAIWWNVSIGMDNCSIYNITTLNISFINESDLASLNASFDVLFDYGVSVDDLSQNYSVSVDNAEYYDFCISDPNITFYSDMTIDYTIAGTVYEYYLVNVTLTNVTQTINLYSQDSTTRVTFTVTDLFDDPIDEAYIKILKYDVGDNAYKTVEVLKTNNDGEAIGNIILYTKWYRFIIEYQGTTYIITDPSKIFSTTKVFRIDLTAADWFANYDTTLGVSTILNFTNSTLNFRYTWNDPTGAMHQGCLQVVKINRTAETTICDSCTESTAATVLCYIGPSSNVVGQRFIAQGYLKYDLIYITDILEKIFGGGKFTPLWEKGESEREFGVFLSFILILALSMIGIWSPVTAIVMTLVGFFIVSTLGFLKLQISALITLVILGIIVIYRISKR